ncbi:MAG TPA: hypothetical protein VEJ63_10995 [Planctomycetota bacterium]|nr:hypothetical protein [Planctomycetota bacterium]
MNASRHALLLIQLAGTLTLLASDAPNILKAAIFPCWWLLTFGLDISKAELLFYGAICSVFTVMDILTVQQGIFTFNQPDVAGLPLYEPLMWGFYVLHTLRMVNASTPVFSWAALLLLIPFAAAFPSVSDPGMLLTVSGGILATGLLMFREREDLSCVLYMMLLGAAVEFTGVRSGQWQYPNAGSAGVPLWFLTLWGGVGFFARRLGLPALVRIQVLLNRRPDGQLQLEARL